MKEEKAQSTTDKSARLPSSACGTEAALTLPEVVIVLAVVFVVGVVFLQALPRRTHCSPRINCASNLKQIGLAFRVWADDNNDHYPQDPALMGTTNSPFSSVWPASGSASPNTFLVYATMSNELNTPKVVVCPTDDRSFATNFNRTMPGADFTGNLRVSYFVGKDAVDTSPLTILAGDRNLCADVADSAALKRSPYGFSPDKSPGGFAFAFGTNSNPFAPATTNLGWTQKMHPAGGNVALADGSVQQWSSSAFRTALQHSQDTNTPANFILFP